MFPNISKVSRKVRILSSFSAFMLAVLPTNQAGAQSEQGGFNPNLDGVAYAVLIQDDGKILIGGAFTSVRPEGGAAIGRNNLVRYLPDGTLDSWFDPDFNGTVTALALQPDGRIVVGGRFSTVDPNRTGNPVVRNGIARINTDGTLDAGFDPNLGATQTPQVYAIVVQSDGKIVFGGDFNQLQPAGTSSPVARNHLARVEAGGSVDSGFAPNPNNIVYSLGLQPDGRLIVGGGFTRMQPGSGSDVTDSSRIARLNVDGSLDSTFNIIADNRVMCMVFQADGSLVIGGDFRSISQGVSGSEFDRISIARIRADGQVDVGFRPNANAQVSTMAIQKDGRILVGGAFTAFLPSGSFNSLSRRYLGRLNPGGTLDTTFVPGPNFSVHAIAVQNDGSIVAGGAFTRFRPESAPGSVIRNRAVRLYSDGTLDAAFELDSGGEVTTLVREADASVIIGGLFSSVGGVTRQNLARIDANGILDESYTASVNGRIVSAVRQSDGKIVIAGEFSEINNTKIQGIARLNTDGSLDSKFDPNPNGKVTTVVLMPDGKLMIGGEFNALAPNDDQEIHFVNFMARLNTDGTVDAAYTAGTSAPVDALGLQADGKLLVGGRFTLVLPSGSEAAQARNHIVRFNDNGTVDTGFDPNANSPITTIALQSDGKILVSGLFTSFRPNGAQEETIRNSIARLNADGTLDAGFDPNPDNTVDAIQVMSDGKILLGGDFLFFKPNGSETIVYRERFARLESDGSVDATPILSANEGVLGFLPEGDGGALIAGGFGGMTSFTVDGGTVAGKIVRLTGDDNLDQDYIVRSSNPSGSQISALAVQGDGSILVGGEFGALGGTENRNIARMFSDGNIDPSFVNQTNGQVNAILIRPDTASDVERGRLIAWLDPDGSYHDTPDAADGSELLGAVSAMAEQSDGRLIVAGSFSDGNLEIGPYLARFNTDASLDATFNPIINLVVSATALQADGKILIGGSFTTINGFARNRIARLNSDGSLDTDFDPNANDLVRDIAVQSDGKILIAGSFTTLTPNGASEATPRGRIARLNADGTVDGGFNPSLDGPAYSVLWQTDGKILIGGSFTSLSSGAGDGVSRINLARVLSTGAVDEAFSAQTGGPVLAISEQPDGKFLIGGSFVSVVATNSQELISRGNIVRLNADGTVDDFDPNANSAVYSIDIEPDGQILIGGSFTGLAPNGQSFDSRRNRLARLNTDGSLDTGFNPNADNGVFAVISRADGTIAVGGSFFFLRPRADIFYGGEFSDISGTGVSNLARVNADGTPDSTFNPQPDRPVDALALQPDGRVLVAGEFSMIAGAVRNRIARFEESGALDEGFDPNASGPVRAMAVQSNGKIMIGGDFLEIGGSTQRRIARLNQDGTLDAAFEAEADDSVVALALQPNGMLIAAGAFSEIGGINRPYLARIRPDGTVDGSFSPAPNGEVQSVALQADGRILVGGSFTAIGGESRAGVARLNSDGSLDVSFQADTNGDVSSVIILENGQPFIAGNFTLVGNEPRYLTSRLGTNIAAIDSMSVSSSLTRITWIRNGASPELTFVSFASSQDGENWTEIGAGNRIPLGNGWEIDADTAFPADEYYFIRAQGVVTTSTKSSSGFINSVTQFYGSVASGPAGTGPVGGGIDVSDVGGDDSSGQTGPSGDADPESGGTTGNGADGSNLGVASIDWEVSTLGAGAAFLNLSARVFLNTDDVFIAGFSVTGAETRRLLVRAIGPGLAVFGIDDHAGSPRFQIRDSGGDVVAENSGWGGDQALAESFAKVGAFPLSSDSMDAAIQVDLAPGTYTIRLSDTDGVPGVILAEIYDSSEESTQSGNRLVNLSSRGPVSSGSGVATCGFIVGGENSALILVRAIGPGLAAFGVSDAIDDPVLRVYDAASGRLLATNDDWAVPLGADPAHPAFDQSDLAGAQELAGAFEIDPAGRDSVVLMVVEPGVYTAQARSGNGTDGEAIIEVYLIDLAQ